MLHIESGGGFVDGVKALSDDLAAMRSEFAKGTGKPIHTVFDDIGGSAAYWIGSQAERAYASTPTTEVGSIGVYMAVPDASRRLDRDGVTMKVFRSHEKKGAGVYGAPITPAQEKVFQERIDSLYTSFVADVARGRGVSVEAITPVATGEVFAGDKAVNARLIDGVKRVEEVIADLDASYPAPSKSRKGRGATAAAPVSTPSAAVTSSGISASSPATSPAAGAPASISITKERIMDPVTTQAAAGGTTPVGSTTIPTTPAAPASAAAPNPADVERIRQEANRLANQRVADLSRLRADFGHVAGVSAVIDKALSNADAKVEDVKAEVVKIATDALRPTGGVEVGAEEWRDKRRPAIELSLVLHESPDLIRALEEDDPKDKGKGARVARALGFSSAADASKAFRTAEGAGLRAIRPRDLAREVLGRSGVRWGLGADDEALYRAAMFGQLPAGIGGGIMGAGGHTSSDFPIILGVLANKTAAAYFAMQALTWQKFCQRGTARDFKGRTLVSRAERGRLKLMSEGMDAERLSAPNERKEVVLIDNYGGTVEFTMQMMRNDDLGLLVNPARDLGESAAILPEDLVYTALQANPTMSDGTALFASGHNNIAGSALTLSYDNFNTAYTAMRRQKSFGPEKRPLDIVPAVLIIEPGNIATANDIRNNAKRPGTPNNDLNAFQGKFDVIDSPRVTNTAAWWLVADTSVPLFVVDFLDGRDQPVMMMKPQSSSTKVEWEGVVTCGVKAANFEAGWYSGQ
ncbi:MAG: S49 family peptidase [Phycisphaerales bacterium]|nr:S49 family peptidase [Phycisphaerales bacterium]